MNLKASEWKGIVIKFSVITEISFSGWKIMTVGLRSVFTLWRSRFDWFTYSKAECIKWYGSISWIFSLDLNFKFVLFVLHFSVEYCIVWNLAIFQLKCIHFGFFLHELVGRVITSGLILEWENRPSYYLQPQKIV